VKDLYDLSSSDTFDSRDVIERIDYLLDTDDLDEKEELATLESFASEAEGHAADWNYGATFIRDSFFEEYAREFASDIGAISDDYGWPLAHIDWTAAANELKMDYSAVELDGVTFWTRS
jgi:hypothetical protein